MLIFSYVVLAIPLIVTASGGVSPSVGIFKGLLSRFGPQLSRLQSRQSFLVPQDCEPICDTFQTTVNNCLTSVCACTTQNMNTGFSCVECAVSEIPEEVSTGQLVLNNFAQGCAVYGLSLSVPTVTLSGTITPSGRSTPTNGVTTGSQLAPPTGIPPTYFTGISSASTALGGPSATSSPQASSTTGSSGSRSGAARVGNNAEVTCVLLSVCLTAVLVMA